MQFYSLEDVDFKTDKGFAETEFLTVAEREDYGEAMRCRKCGDIISKLKWLPPFRVTLEMFKKQYGNIVFGTGGDFIVDNYWKSCYEKSGLTGLEFIGEAEVVGFLCRNGVRKKTLPPPPIYYVARITTRGGIAIDIEKSGFLYKKGEEPTCDLCRSGFIAYYPKVVVDESTWNGLDITFASGVGNLRVVSQRFKDWWDSCHFNNGKVISVEEVHNDWRWSADGPFVNCKGEIVT